jgi:hypothetical protein
MIAFIRKSLKDQNKLDVMSLMPYSKSKKPNRKEEILHFKVCW